MTVYLIGGPPKCGKTTLAKHLSKKLSVSWISADTLQNVVYAYASPKEHAKLFPHTYLRGDNNDDLYGKYSADEIMENYVKQGKTTYEAIRMTVETYLVDEDDFIIEGYQVTPECVNSILEKFGDKNIRPIFLIRNDAENFLENLHKSSTPNDWILRKTKNKDTFRNIARMILHYSDYFEKEANKYGFRVFRMDENFENTIENITKFIASR